MAKLTPVVIDFESFWSTDHSLTKMSPIEYVMSPKTEIISCAAKTNGHDTIVVFGEDNIRQWFEAFDWSDKLVVAHNMSGFDAMILSWRFGVRPAMWGCTLAMSRPIHAKEAGGSLAKLVEHYGIGVKDQSALVQTKGKNLKDFTRDEIMAMRQYNAADVDQCWKLFKILHKLTSKDEMRLIDMTIRMLVEPQFQVDKPLLLDTLRDERGRKSAMLLDLAQKIGVWDGTPTAFPDNITDEITKTLGSAAKFSKLLNDLDVAVPTKISPTTGKEAPALAKTDEAFLALTEHDNPIVAAAAQARLGVKSTLLETRIQAFLDAANAADGKLPVPLKYYGADTTGRWSGWAYNCFPAGHEVLTPKGWVDIAYWEPDEPIMQWWPDGSTSWCINAGKVTHQHDGPMVRLSGPFVNGLFTPDHRVPKTTTRGITDKTAGWVADHSGLDGVPAAGVFVGGSSPLTADQVRFLVAVAADGCFTKKGELRFGFRRQRKIDRLVRLVNKIGHMPEARVYDYRDKPNNHWVFTLKRSAVPDWVCKGFGPWVLDLSRDALDALVDELQYWDGSPHSLTGNTCFYTSLLDQALWVSTALHLSGTPARVGVRHEGKVDVYARSSATTSATGQYEKFSGRVYCPQVESSYILVRHNNTIHVTGNCQNLPRVSGKPSDALRNCLKAPPGHKVVVADLSGIELRVNHFLWKVPSSMALYQADPEKADLYKDFAAALYGIPKAEVTKAQRQVGKVAHLGLGFGSGAATFQKVAKLMGGVDLSLEESLDVVTKWRAMYAEIVKGWKDCHASLVKIAGGVEEAIDPWGLCWTCSDGIRTPKGFIRYPGLRKEIGDDGKGEWWYGHGRNKARIYAGKITENIVQHLARNVIADNALDVKRATGRTPALMVHDELVYVVPEDQAESVLDTVQGIMRTPPVWWPELVTWSEGDIADTYGAAK